MRGAPWAIGLAAVSLLAGRPAFAAEHEEGYDPKKEASVLLRGGNELYAKGSYADALKLFQKAYDAFPSPKLFYNMALCEQQLGQHLAAANHYRLFVEKVGDDSAVAREKSAANAQVASAATHYGLLRFSAQPADARFDVDGDRVMGSAQFVKPGKHSVVASAPGRKLHQEGVEVRAGEERNVVVSLPEAAGKTEDVPPVEVLRPDPHGDGKDGQPEEWVGGQPAPGAPVVPYSIVAGGGVLLGASALTGFFAWRDNQTLGQYVNGGVALASDQAVANMRATVRREAWLSTGLMGAGLAAGAVGGALLFLHFRGSSSEAPPPTLVMLGPSGAALAGRF